jgi:undecaprenyl-diphosphatase
VIIAQPVDLERTKKRRHRAFSSLASALVDFSLYQLLNDFVARNDWLEDPLRFFALSAQWFFVAILVALFFARGKWRSVNGRRGVAGAGLSAILALGIAHVIATLWDRARPYEAHANAHLFISRSPDPSFPSDHATAAFALAVAVFLWHRRAGWLMLAMATVVALSRVAVGTHYPGDVLGGAAVGAASALLVYHLPAARRFTYALGDFAGRLYDRVATWALRRLRLSAGAT